MKGGNFGDKSPGPSGGGGQYFAKPQVTMAVTESFNYCQETKVSRRGEPEKRQGGYRLQLICELSGKHNAGRA